MAKESRNREYGCRGNGRCAIIAVCDRPERGSARCSKGRCNSFRDPKNPKYRR